MRYFGTHTRRFFFFLVGEVNKVCTRTESASQKKPGNFSLFPRHIQAGISNLFTPSHSPCLRANHLREGNSGLIIPICLPRRGQPRPGRIDEAIRPEAAKGLVAVDGRVGVEPGHDFLEVVAAFGLGGAPEPEL